MHSQAPAVTRKHVSTLDGIRGIAILMVLGIHFAYSGALPEPPPRFLSLFHFLVFGWMGVDLFFVLSGFLITGILLDTIAAPNYFKSFYARRTLRIFPIYYLVIVLVLCLTPFALRFPALFPYLPGYPLIAASFFYMQNWWMAFHPMAPRVVIGDYWSLGVEEQFYLLWPLIVFKLSRRNVTRLCIAICLATPVLRLVLYRHDPESFLVFVSTLTRMDTLLWGALAAIAVRTTGLLQKLEPWLTPLAFTCAAAMLIIDFPLHELYSRALFTQSIGYTLIAIGFAAFLLKGYLADGTTSLLARFLNSKVLRGFGRYSYGIYIFHAFFLTAMRVTLGERTWYGHSLPRSALLAVLFLAITYGTAFASFHLYESRFLRLKSRFKAEKLPVAVA